LKLPPDPKGRLSRSFSRVRQELLSKGKTHTPDQAAIVAMKVTCGDLNSQACRKAQPLDNVEGSCNQTGRKKRLFFSLERAIKEEYGIRLHFRPKNLGHLELKRIVKDNLPPEHAYPTLR